MCDKERSGSYELTEKCVCGHWGGPDIVYASIVSEGFSVLELFKIPDPHTSAYHSYIISISFSDVLEVWSELITQLKLNNLLNTYNSWLLVKNKSHEMWANLTVLHLIILPLPNFKKIVQKRIV